MKYCMFKNINTYMNKCTNNRFVNYLVKLPYWLIHHVNGDTRFESEVLFCILNHLSDTLIFYTFTKNIGSSVTNISCTLFEGRDIYPCLHKVKIIYKFI